MNNKKEVTAIEKEVKNDIMSTDVFVRILSDNRNFYEMKYDLNKSFDMFKDFSRRYTRFDPLSEVSRFNENLLSDVSDELFDMLQISREYNNKTGGIFDIGLLPVLQNEGYVVSKSKGFIDPKLLDVYNPLTSYTSVSEIELDPLEKTVKKPEHLKIDLGGIGKGYVVDKVATFLGKKYQNYVVDAGGDMYFAGKDLKNGYDYWITSLEHPLVTNEVFKYIKLSDKAIATSGINRRKWTRGGGEKHHIIDPRTMQSARTDILTATVIADKAYEADILAKTVLILGSVEGMEFAKKCGVPAFVIDRNLKAYSVGFDNFIYE